MKNPFLKLANLLFRSRENDWLFGEKRFVYFAESKDPEDDTGIEKEAKGKEVKKVEKEELPETIAPEVFETRSGVVGEVHSLFDQIEYNLPPDVDQERLKKAKEIVNKNASELEIYEKQFDTKSLEFIGEMGVESTTELQDEIWKVLYSVVPEFKTQALKEYKSFNPDLIPPNLSMKLKKGLAAIWKKNTEKKLSSRFLNKFIADSLKIMDKVAEYEFEIFKSITEAKEVMWDMYDHRKKQNAEQMMLRGAINYSGLPLEKGMEFTGIENVITGWQENHEPIKEKHSKNWVVTDVYINKERKVDPEDPKNKVKMKMTGVWVALSSGNQVYRMPMSRLPEFVNLHRIKPIVKNKKDLYNHVPHLKEMNIELKPGMEIEYDEWVYDKDKQKYIAVPKKVKIKYLDDKTVKLDREISIFISNDPEDKPKDEVSLGEFSVWLNRNISLPTMNVDELKIKLNEHYEFMNKKYKRNPDCHDPIVLAKGEVIYADAPGNPLYQITNDPFSEGVVKLSQGMEFTFPQFLKWVYEYGMEPFKPELEANKVKYYMKGSNNSAKKAMENAQLTQDGFLKEGIWRDTFKKLKEKGIKGIAEGPELNIKQDVRNTPMKVSHSFLREFVHNTYLMDIDSIWQLFKTGKEYYTRNWRRRQKARYSAIGKGVPWFANEFERINQQAETEEMQQFKEAMDQWGVRQIEETMYTTNNRDQLKACFNTLAEKGQIRWDDRRLWDAINKFTDINHKIPMPEPGQDPNTPFREGTGQLFQGIDVAGKAPVDFIPEALDSLWGESSYVSWKRQNDSAMEDGISKSYNKAEELESDPNNTGGIAKELQNLLERHLRGEYVDPTEFEGMLRFIVEMGKAGGKHKMYYLLMGTSAKYPPGDPNGRSIMGWDRVGRFISKYCNQFPAMDYFSSSNTDPKRDATTGEIFTRAWVKRDFDHLTRPWVERFVKTGKADPPSDADKFMWKEVLTSDAFQKRLEKGIRNAQNIDHDDSPYFIPALKDTEIESACAASGGETKKFTVQGYKNAYIGFGLRMRSLKDKYDEESGFKAKGQVSFENQYLQKLVTTFQAYMKYDSILDNRYRRGSESRLQRFSSHDYRSGCIWDGNRALQTYKEEMKDLIIQVARAYGEGENSDLIETPFERLPSIKGDDKLIKKQTKIEHSIENWGSAFEKMVMKDGGKKLLQIVEKHKFVAEDLGDLTEAEKIRNKMNMEVLEGVRTPEAEAE